jgi:hypothetical protein
LLNKDLGAREEARDVLLDVLVLGWWRSLSSSRWIA